MKDAAKEGKDKDNRLVLMAIDRVNRVTQTYVEFMDLAQRHETDKRAAGGGGNWDLWCGRISI